VNLWWRLLTLVLTWRWRPSCPVLAPATKTFRVLPADLDVLGHVNNGRYLTLLDVCRSDLILRSGMLPLLRKRRWYPVIAAETIQFRKSLPLFAQFEVSTRIIGWNDRVFVVEHLFRLGGELAALAYVVARFLGSKQARVSPAELLIAAGYTGEDLPLPGWIDAWLRTLNDAATSLAQPLKPASFAERN
jgi:acyl-CoA thioesterase FadM